VSGRWGRANTESGATGVDGGTGKGGANAIASSICWQGVSITSHRIRAPVSRDLGRPEPDRSVLRRLEGGGAWARAQ